MPHSSLSCKIKADTSALPDEADESRAKLEQILQLVKHLPMTTDRLEDTETIDGKMDIMRRYLDSLTAYASSVYKSSTQLGADDEEVEVPRRLTAAVDPQNEDQGNGQWPLGKHEGSQGSSDTLADHQPPGPQQQEHNTLPATHSSHLEVRRVEEFVAPDWSIPLHGQKPTAISVSLDSAKLGCICGNTIMVWDTATREVVSDFAYEAPTGWFSDKGRRRCSLSNLSFVGKPARHIAVEVVRGKKAQVHVLDLYSREKLLVIDKPATGSDGVQGL